MFSLMGNCMSWIKKRREPNHNVTIAILGLDNAGKSVATSGLVGDPVENTAPTVGFILEEFQYDKFDVKMFDLGGGKNIRSIWKNYFAEIHGAIYVLDSTDHDRMEESRKELEGVIENPKMFGKPILLLANKQDLHGALDELDICETFNLEELVNLHKCPCRLETCVANKGHGKKLDKPIKDGMTWLLQTVKQDYDHLNTRVERDSKKQREVEEKERQEKRERYKRLKEERERQAKENGENEDDTADDIDGGDPFKRLDYNELKAKEARLKEEKKKEKERLRLEKEFNERNNKSPRDKKELRNSISRSPRDQKTNMNSDSDDDMFIVPGSKRSPRRSIESVPNKHLLPVFDKSGMMNGHALNKLHAEDEEENMSPSPRKLAGKLEPLVIGEKEEIKKKKKKKIKKNKTAPAPYTEEDSPPAPVAVPRIGRSIPQGWDTPPEQRSALGSLAPLRSVPRLSPISEPAKNSEGGIREGIHETVKQFGPNMDNDDDIVT